MADFNIAAAMAAIQQQRDAQPLRYAPGTLSLDARKAMEQKRQFNNELAENQRQFNIEAQMKAAAAARAASGGGGGGSGGTGGKLSQWEQKIVGQNLANNTVLSRYQENAEKYKDGSNVDPLHWAIREALTGTTAEGTSSGVYQNILDSSGDPTKAVDALLGSLGMDAKGYFSGNNAGLGNIYNTVKGKQQSEQSLMNQVLADYMNQ